MTPLRRLSATAVLALCSAAFAAAVPSEIYRPAGAQDVRSEQHGHDEYEC